MTESMQLAVVKTTQQQQLVPVVQNRQLIPLLQSRTSHLEAPIMQLSGHGGEVLCIDFHPNGEIIASASFDKRIFLWRVYGECENFLALPGHSSAILDLRFAEGGSTILSCSADKTVQLFDSETGNRIRKFVGHSSFVNSCSPAREQPSHLFVSGSDDRTARLWDTRVKAVQQTFLHDYQVTTVAFAQNNNAIFTAGIDNTIRMFDIRKSGGLLTLEGHRDTITGLSLSPDGSYILSNSMDNTLRVWDVRPFCSASRNVKTFVGHKHSFEKNLLRCAWSPDANQVTCGSADSFVYVWDTNTGNILYKLPGHSGSVNDARFHPKEPIIASASSDANIFLGELKL